MIRMLLVFLTCIPLAVWSQEFNSSVLKVAESYVGGGYRWKSTGTPKTLLHKEKVLLAKSASGTYCSGFTFTVAFDVLTEGGLLEDMTHQQMRQFQVAWYGASQSSAETQCLFALETHGLGRAISEEEVEPGDFVQFWRNNGSGHSAVFIGWSYGTDGDRNGIRYRSSQKSTQGIGNREEKWGSGEKNINRKRLYFARISEN